MSDYLDRLEQRILALEDAIDPKQPAEDDEESKGCVWDIASVYSEKESLKTANAILHAKVAALRAESQRLADICEEQDIAIYKLTQAGYSLADAYSAHLSHNA